MKRPAMSEKRDANVLVSGLLSPYGPPGRILDALLAGILTLVFDDRILGEYEDVLTRQEFGSDPDHAMFIEVAMAGRSDAIVTGNKARVPQGGTAASPYCRRPRVWNGFAPTTRYPEDSIRPLSDGAADLSRLSASSGTARHTGSYAPSDRRFPGRRRPQHPCGVFVPVHLQAARKPVHMEGFAALQTPPDSASCHSLAKAKRRGPPPSAAAQVHRLRWRAETGGPLLYQIPAIAVKNHPQSP